MQFWALGLTAISALAFWVPIFVGYFYMQSFKERLERRNLWKPNTYAYLFKGPRVSLQTYRRRYILRPRKFFPRLALGFCLVSGRPHIQIEEVSAHQRLKRMEKSWFKIFLSDI